jgi:hypothetical protein
MNLEDVNRTYMIATLGYLVELWQEVLNWFFNSVLLYAPECPEPRSDTLNPTKAQKLTLPNIPEVSHTTLVLIQRLTLLRLYHVFGRRP